MCYNPRVNTARIRRILGMVDKPVEKRAVGPTARTMSSSVTSVVSTPGAGTGTAAARARDLGTNWKVGDRVCFRQESLPATYEVTRVNPNPDGSQMIELAGMFGLYAGHLFVQGPPTGSLADSLPSLAAKPAQVESKMLEDLRVEKSRLRREITEHEKATKELELKAGGIEYQISWLERHPEAEEIFNFVEEVRRQNARDEAAPGL